MYLCFHISICIMIIHKYLNKLYINNKIRTKRSELIQINRKKQYICINSESFLYNNIIIYYNNIMSWQHIYVYVR